MATTHEIKITPATFTNEEQLALMDHLDFGVDYHNIAIGGTIILWLITDPAWDTKVPQELHYLRHRAHYQAVFQAREENADYEPQTDDLFATIRFSSPYRWQSLDSKPFLVRPREEQPDDISPGFVWIGNANQLYRNEDLRFYRFNKDTGEYELIDSRDAEPKLPKLPSMITEMITGGPFYADDAEAVCEEGDELNIRRMMGAYVTRTVKLEDLGDKEMIQGVAERMRNDLGDHAADEWLRLASTTIIGLSDRQIRINLAKMTKLVDDAYKVMIAKNREKGDE